MNLSPRAAIVSTAHRGGAKSICTTKTPCLDVWGIVQDIPDLALPAQLDGPDLVTGGRLLAHSGKAAAQHFRVRMGEIRRTRTRRFVQQLLTK
jgi:hypothetical protein